MTCSLKFLLRYLLTTVLLFVAAKVVFMLVCHEGHVFTIADVWQVVRHGLSLDLSTALYVVIVPFLLVAVGTWWQSDVLNRLLRGYNVVVAILMALAFVADTSLYPFWGFKLNAACLQYIDTPTEAMASVSTAYIARRAVALVLAAVIAYRVLPDSLPACAGRRLRSVLLQLVLIPLIVIGIRGGVSESTTNIGQVYYAQDQFLNHAAVNPVFSFLYSLSHQMGDAAAYTFFSDEECQRLAADVYTTESIDADTLLTTRRPDIVVILLESAGEEFAAAMPRLQQLKGEGVSFTRCYANSWRTDRGTVSTLSGYPSFPHLSVMKMPEKSRTLPSIARTLTNEGYTSCYLYGGDINFTNMRSYLVSTGWQRLISMDDYSAQERHTAKWGVRDDITFATLSQLIASPRQDDAPRLIGYSTLSSHEPWDVPTQTIAGDEKLNAFAYLDSCLGNFIDSLRQTPQWQNLLVILTADHGINYRDIDQLTPLAKNHIPMLWIGGAIREPRRVDVLCNQTDLAATLLGQLGLSHREFTFSRDVLSATYVHPTATNNYSNAQWIADSTGHVLYDFDAQRVAVSQGSDGARLLRLNKAILQTTLNDLKQRR